MAAAAQTLRLTQRGKGDVPAQHAPRRLSPHTGGVAERAGSGLRTLTQGRDTGLDGLWEGAAMGYYCDQSFPSAVYISQVTDLQSPFTPRAPWGGFADRFSIAISRNVRQYAFSTLCLMGLITNGPIMDRNLYNDTNYSPQNSAHTPREASSYTHSPYLHCCTKCVTKGKMSFQFWIEQRKVFVYVT